MKKEEFNKYWYLNYPESVPIAYLFKYKYTDRWFRIHSLPNSKRYADNNTELELLLSRQNEIITDLFGIKTPILIVVGDYNFRGKRTAHITMKEEVFKPYSFTRVENINLYEVDAEEYTEDEIYRPAFAQSVWMPKFHDTLLKEIANDNTRAFFISFDKSIIVAPYDGGVDFIVKNSWTKENYRNKYSDWLSDREDGL